MHCSQIPVSTQEIGSGACLALGSCAGSPGPERSLLVAPPLIPQEPTAGPSRKSRSNDSHWAWGRQAQETVARLALDACSPDLLIPRDGHAWPSLCQVLETGTAWG